MKGRATIPTMVLIALLMIPSAQGEIIFVDADATGANDGSSWADAFNYLQDALAKALSGDEIRVAEGIYTPDSNSADPNGSGDRTATFQLINGGTLKGGYAGFGEPEPNACDIELYETILSGDLDDNDAGDIYDSSRNENSYHVVVGSLTDSTAVLDGFTIAGGNANYYSGYPPYAYSCGGGIYTDSGGATVLNCMFSGNLAKYGGGGTYNLSSVLKFINCKFNSNYATWWGDGGGMYNEESSPTLISCTFIKNGATHGGAMYNKNSSPIVTNCTFSRNTALFRGGGILCTDNSTATIEGNIIEGNSANTGGGICCYESSSIIKNNIIRNNEVSWGPAGGVAYGIGGGVFCRYSSATIKDNVITHNLAKSRGAGIAIYYSDLIICNNIISANEAMIQPSSVFIVGGGIYCARSSAVMANNNTIVGNRARDPLSSWEYLFVEGGGIWCSSDSELILLNSILWCNRPDEVHSHPESVEVTYTDIRGGWPGEGNIDYEPLFVDPGYWDPNGTPEDANDDFWVDGDYHLLADSPCIDAGDPNYVAEPNETDFDGKPRVIGGRIDMGAYEYSPPIQADVYIEPDTLNLTSKGKWITAFVQLPEGYKVADIVPNSVLLDNEIEPERFWLAEDNQVAIAKFSREEVQAVLIAGEVELTITGQLSNGTLFEGTDAIRVIDEGGGKN